MGGEERTPILSSPTSSPAQRHEHYGSPPKKGKFGFPSSPQPKRTLRLQLERLRRQLWRTPEFTTTFKSVVGSGFFALPYGFRLAGVVGGLACMAVVSLMTLLTTKQLVLAARKYKRMRPDMREDAQIGFLELGEDVFMPGGWMVSFLFLSLLLSQFVAVCAYMVFFQTTLSPLVLEIPGVSSSMATWVELAVVATCVLVQLALATFPDPSFLDKTSFFGNIAFFCSFLFILISGFLFYPPDLSGNTVLFNDASGFFACFGIASFTLSAHAECLGIYSSADEVAKEVYPEVVEQVTLLTAVLYSLLALFCYSCFGQDVDQSIFANFTRDGSVLGKCLSISICVMLSVNYPLTLFPVHQMVETKLELTHSYNMPLSSLEAAPSMRTLSRAQLATRWAVIIASGCVAFVINDRFGEISEIGGAFIALVAFVFPPFFFVTMHGGWEMQTWKSTILNCAVIAVGFLGWLTSLRDGVVVLLKES